VGDFAQASARFVLEGASATSPDTARFSSAAGWFALSLFRVRALATLEIKADLHPTVAVGGGGGGGGGVEALCRFCESSLAPENASAAYGGAGAPPGLAGRVCAAPDCEAAAAASCGLVKSCGHACGGIAGETECLPCYHGCDGPSPPPGDPCMCCYTDALGAAPAARLGCGHVFHASCLARKLKAGWPEAHMSFGFLGCPLCKAPMAPATHPALATLLPPLLALQAELHKKVLMRVRAEGKEGDPEITDPASRFHGDPLAWGLHRYAYYKCFKCEKPYYGGLRACGVGGAGEWDPQELVCPNCLPMGGGKCPKGHPDDFQQFKCRFCCSPSAFICSG
jgi:E3 ubiquitin-protein ligase MYCBP2